MKTLLIVLGITALIASPFVGLEIGRRASAIQKETASVAAEQNNSIDLVRQRATDQRLAALATQSKSLATDLEARAAAAERLNDPAHAQMREERIEDMAEAIRRANASPTP
jgi:hypothetical protein